MGVAEVCRQLSGDAVLYIRNGHPPGRGKDEKGFPLVVGLIKKTGDMRPEQGEEALSVFIGDGDDNRNIRAAPF